MTDSEKLDLLLVGMEGMQGDIAALKNGQKEIRKDVKKNCTLFYSYRNSY